jgi:hypothetical protein
MGDKAFPELLNLITNQGNHFYEKLPLTQIPHNLIYKQNGELVFYR